MSITAADLPKRATLSGFANAAGVLSLVFTAGRNPWSVEQITIEMPGAVVGTQAFLRVNDVLVSPMIAFADAAAGEPPLPVRPGDVVEIEWLGAPAGAAGKVLVIYREAPYR